MTTETKAFRLSYRVDIETHDPPVAAVPQGRAPADALMVIATTEHEDGALDFDFRSHDGLGNQTMHDEDVFRVWLALTQKLSGSETLSEGHRNLCRITFSTFIDMVALAKKQAEDGGGGDAGGGTDPVVH